MKMKIGLIATSGFYPLGHGGPQIVSYEMTKWLSKLGYELLVLVPVKNSSQIKRIKPMERVTFKFIETDIPSHLIQINLKLLSILKSIQKECCLVHYSAPPIDLDVFWPLLLKLGQRPQTYYYMGDVHNYPSRFSIFRINQRFLDKIIVISNFAYALLRASIKISPDRLAYIPLGIDVERYNSAHPRTLEGEPSILYVGRLDPDKDLTTLFKAFSLIQKSLHSSRLHIIGSGSREAECKSLAKELGIHRQTIWHGQKDNLELPPYYKGSDLVVYPIFQYFTNGLGLVAMEAMAARKPLVTTSIPGNREFCQDRKNVLLYPLADHEALAKRILELHHDRELAKRISTNAYYFIRNYDWRNVIVKFDKVWQELVS